MSISDHGKFLGGKNSVAAARDRAGEKGRSPAIVEARRDINERRDL